MKKIFAIAVVLAVLVAAVAIAVRQGMIVLPSAPAPLEDPVDRVVKAVVPTATPTPSVTRTPEPVAAQVAAPITTATHTVRPTATPSAQMVASKSTDTPTPSPTPVATDTATVVPTIIPTTTATPTAIPVPTAEPTTTPKPLNLVLDAEATVDGYWSDGTANIELVLSLRNEGSLPFQDNQPINVSCTHNDNVVEGCNANTGISLQDGFGLATANLTLRAPMGLIMLDIDYGGDAPHTMSVNVQKRILGVDRDIWDCYSDRSPTPSDYNPSLFDYGCYGWHSKTVEKWHSDSTVKVWATGNPNYIQVFREIIDEHLSPVLNLDFEWVDDELEADFVATLGISAAESDKSEWRKCASYWGCGGVTEIKNGAIRSAHLVVFHLESLDEILNDREALKRELTGIVIHESLHALASVGHGHKVLSIMAGGGYLSFMDKAVLRLNSHPLVKPGMTMATMEPLIVFKDELLDNPEMELDSYTTLEHAFAALQNAETARMKVRGGWSGGGCDDERFGHPERAILEIGHFWKWSHDPLLVHLKDGARDFYIFYSSEAADAGENGWQHWGKSVRGWNQISRRQLSNDTAWWIKNSKPHWTFFLALYNLSADDIRIAEKANGKIVLEIEFNPTEFVVSWSLSDETLKMTLVIDEETYKVDSYTWTWHYGNRSYCSTYSEEAKDFEYGIEIEIPDAIVKGSKYALP